MSKLPTFFASAVIATASVFASAAAAPHDPARTTGLETTWIPLAGDWSTPANWSGGEPTVVNTAVIPAGVANVTQSGETCATLVLGVGGTPGAVTIAGGTLDVAATILVGNATESSTGTLLQSGGAVTASILDLRSGTVSVNNGTCDVSTTTVRTATSFSVIFDGDYSCSGALTVEFGGGFTITTGTFDAGTSLADIAVVGGVFNCSPLSDVSFQNLTFDGDQAIFSPQLTSDGFTPIDVAGALTLDGFLAVSDNGAPDGRYDLIVAQTLIGSFDFVDLPDGEWSWGTENGTLFVVKGQKVPVETTTWGALKHSFSE